MSLHCQACTSFCCCIILEVSNEHGDQVESLGLWNVAPGVRQGWVWYLFGCVQQRSGLGSACLLDHLIEEALLVLEQHIGFIKLPDPAGIQNLQSRILSEAWMVKHGLSVHQNQTFHVTRADTGAGFWVTEPWTLSWAPWCWFWTKDQWFTRVFILAQGWSSVKPNNHTLNTLSNLSSHPCPQVKHKDQCQFKRFGNVYITKGAEITGDLFGLVLTPVVLYTHPLLLRCVFSFFLCVTTLLLWP